jgi:hypothetical protein
MPAASFVERHGLWNAERREAAERMLAALAQRGMHTVRFAFADQHGILRGKTVVATEAAGALASWASPPRCSRRTPRTARCSRCSRPAAASGCARCRARPTC